MKKPLSGEGSLSRASSIKSTTDAKELSQKSSSKASVSTESVLNVESRTKSENSLSSTNLPNQVQEEKNEIASENQSVATKPNESGVSESTGLTSIQEQISPLTESELDENRSLVNGNEGSESSVCIGNENLVSVGSNLHETQKTEVKSGATDFDKSQDNANTTIGNVVINDAENEATTENGCDKAFNAVTETSSIDVSDQSPRDQWESKSNGDSLLDIDAVIDSLMSMDKLVDATEFDSQSIEPELVETNGIQQSTENGTDPDHESQSFTQPLLTNGCAASETSHAAKNTENFDDTVLTKTSPPVITGNDVEISDKFSQDSIKSSNDGIKAEDPVHPIEGKV